MASVEAAEAASHGMVGFRGAGTDRHGRVGAADAYADGHDTRGPTESLWAGWCMHCQHSAHLQHALAGTDGDCTAIASLISVATNRPRSRCRERKRRCVSGDDAMS